MGCRWYGDWARTAWATRRLRGDGPNTPLHYNRTSAAVKEKAGYDLAMPRAGDTRAADLRERIARNLGLARDYRGKTQAELAAAAGVSLDGYRPWEQGGRAPDAGILGVLADELEIAPGDLYLEHPPTAWLKAAARRAADEDSDQPAK